MDERRIQELERKLKLIIKTMYKVLMPFRKLKYHIFKGSIFVV